MIAQSDTAIYAQLAAGSTARQEIQAMAHKDRRYIYRPWITLPDGSRIYAKNYGKRAFRIPVEDDRDA
jgi:hypothetical protein